MSGAMRKIGEYLGLLEDTGVYDDEYDEQGYADAGHQQQPRRSSVPSQAQPAPVADISQRRRAQGPRRHRLRPSSRSSPASRRSIRAPTTRRAPSARTSATASR